MNSGDLHFLPLPQFAVWSTSREDALRIISILFSRKNSLRLPLMLAFEAQRLFVKEAFIALAFGSCFRNSKTSAHAAPARASICSDMHRDWARRPIVVQRTYVRRAIDSGLPFARLRISIRFQIFFSVVGLVLWGAASFSDPSCIL